MSRTNRIAVFAALALLVAMAGTVLATRAPTAETPAPQLADEHEEGETEDEAAPDDVVVDRVSERLGVDAARVRELAAEHGFGTAVRLLAWDQASDEVTVEDLLERRANGEGWGEMAKQLGLHPGIGSIVGNGGGHGREGAPGQQRGGDEDN